MENTDWSNEAKNEMIVEPQDEAAYKDTLHEILGLLETGDKIGALEKFGEAHRTAMHIGDGERRGEATKILNTFEEILRDEHGHNGEYARKVNEQVEGIVAFSKKHL